MTGDPLETFRALGAPSLLPTEGRIDVDGLTERVEVTRSADGTPRIDAASTDDLWFAQGFLTAGERLFQIEMTLRAASGRLSELFGASSLDQDRYTRTIGLHLAAARHVQAWTDLDRAIHTRFRAGVRAWIDHASAMPIEYTILGATPDLPDDPIAWAGGFALLAWGLSNNLEQELLRARIADRLGPDAVASLMPPTSGRGGVGSNAWALAGSRTVNGSPLLANDPHLPALQPSPWMPFDLHAPGYEARGVALTFSPGIILGACAHHAWGATNVTGDVQDLFVVTDTDVTDTREESIAVRGEPEPRIHRVRETQHGPIVDRVPVGAKATAWEDLDHTLALRWTGAEYGLRPSIVLEVAAASSFEEFRRAVLQIGCPGQNFVYADVEGHIGYQLTGAYPVRTRGDGSRPIPDHGWDGWIPAGELPWLADPDEGFIVSANDAQHAAGTTHLISTDFHASHRADRIRELLLARPRHDVASLARIQRDTVSLAARGAVPALLTRTAPTAARREALDLLAAWDHDLAADSRAASIYEAWVRAIARRALAGPLGEDLFRAYTADIETWSCSVLPALLDEPGGWIDDEGIGAALDDVLETFGPSIPEWGEHHRLVLAHPLARIPGAEAFFTAVDVPVGGDEQTVAQTGVDEVAGPTVAIAPSWRAVWDLADLRAGRTTLPAGVSGNPASPHWNDQVAWFAGVEPGPASDPLGTLELHPPTPA